MSEQPAYHISCNAIRSIILGILGVVSWIFPFSFYLDLLSFNDEWLKGLQNFADPWVFIISLVLGMAGIVAGIRVLREEGDNFPAMIGTLLGGLTILFTLSAWFIAALFF
jgi:hypothetical protein